MVGTVKKSTETICWTWLSRNDRQVWLGDFRGRTIYLLTLVSPMSIPSLSNSPWMRGAPQSGLARLFRQFSWNQSRAAKYIGIEPGVSRLPGASVFHGFRSSKLVRGSTHKSAHNNTKAGFKS